ncbi:MAG TPA: glycosyltransferase, partial [Terriglobia bacterium]|nr:glycosyltransferase [Terriglobia bacterium]
NNRCLTEDCVNSIFRNTPEDQFELVIVDNGSTDGTWDYLQSLGSRARIIRNRRNLFFARGSNRGGWAARSEHIVFLNNDTIVSPGWLEELLRPLENDPAAGITGNKQLFPATHPTCANRVWHAGMVVGENRLPWHICYGFDREHPAVTRERECVSVSGCCLAIRRRLFEELGGFDPYFQNGFEDVDLCLRARELGYKVVYAPKSEIVHLVSSSESRFDREAINQEKFTARWSERLIPDERDFLKTSGLLPSETDRETRVGFVSTFNQKGAHSRRAEELVRSYPSGSTVVLAEFGIHDRRPEPDAPFVIRCWDRTGAWYYPLLRWATTLDLDVIHVHFEPSLFPPGFVELLQALKAAGKSIIFSVRGNPDGTPLWTGIAHFADAVVVGAESERKRLVRVGLASWKVHVIRAGDAEGHWALYRSITSKADRPLRVRWEGPQLVNHSLALVNRELERALLENERLELTIAPVGPDSFGDLLGSDFRALAQLYGRFLPGVDIHIRHEWPPSWIPPAEGRWVVIQPWEYGSVPAEWIAAVNRHIDEMWVPSTFVRRLYLDSGANPDRVRVVPNGVDADLFRPGLKPYPLRGARRFKFLFVGGTIHRKGIDVLLHSYVQAFQPDDDVSLIIKDIGTGDVYQGQGIGDAIREIEAEGSTPHIIYVDRNLTDTEMARLYNACDCLVHPYRGEGFALPVLEAMSCGLPVVVTAGGATDDFVDDSVGFRIPATRRVFGARMISGLKTAGDLWLLEPDGDALSKTMIDLVKRPDCARESGRRARRKVVGAWTWRHAARQAMEGLEALRRRPIGRHLRTVDAAALIDVADDRDIETIVSSLHRSSYANLAIFARTRSRTSAPELRLAFPEIEILHDDLFSEAIATIRTTIRAPYLALITQPCVFSRHWLRQLTETPDAEGGDPRIIAPWTEWIDPGAAAETEFQKRARLSWREKRGARRRVNSIPPGCALVHWTCLDPETAAPQADANEWLEELKTRDVPIVLAEDTWVGLLPPPAIVPSGLGGLLAHTLA